MDKRLTLNNKIQQLEFFSEYSLIKIKIINNFPKVYLLVGKIGPFINGDIIETPLWIAVLLAKSNYCRIFFPNWLKIKWLEKKIYIEKKTENLQHIPFNYLEFGKILIANNKFKISLKNSLLALLELIHSIRFLKIWRCLKKLNGIIDAIKLDGIASVELLTFKNVFIILLCYFSLK
jgi:hypothetical protein